jgi:hypothetical protein
MYGGVVRYICDHWSPSTYSPTAVLMTQVPGWAWIAWGVGSLAVFGILEFAALKSPAVGDTLTENIRRWLGIEPPSRQRQIAVPVFLGAVVSFVAWFVLHIVQD